MCRGPLKDGAFAVRRLSEISSARLEFDVAYLEHMPRAFVQKPDDMRVQLVDGLAMLGNVHDIEFAKLNTENRTC